tara:strand:+ start:1070 stop:1282 length:213 start_codon:yes stop_codon:yes gene_type:complete
MKNKKMLITSLSTLFYSWGGDTPDEVFWGANELLDWFEDEFEVKLNIRFERDENTFETNYDDVINVINSL